jgi:hypothetical protein
MANTFWPANYVPGTNIVLYGVNTSTGQIQTTAGSGGNLFSGIQMLCAATGGMTSGTNTSTQQQQAGPNPQRRPLSAQARRNIAAAQRKRHLQAKQQQRGKTMAAGASS